MKNFDRYAAAYRNMNGDARLLILNVVESYAKQYPAPSLRPRLFLVPQNVVNAQLCRLVGDRVD
jgi:hypothetical protein